MLGLQWPQAAPVSMTLPSTVRRTGGLKISVAASAGTFGASSNDTNNNRATGGYGNRVTMLMRSIVP
jgi:hypothetical protein